MGVQLFTECTAPVDATVAPNSTMGIGKGIKSGTNAPQQETMTSSKRRIMTTTDMNEDKISALVDEWYLSSDELNDSGKRKSGDDNDSNDEEGDGDEEDEDGDDEIDGLEEEDAENSVEDEDENEESQEDEESIVDEDEACDEMPDVPTNEEDQYSGDADQSDLNKEEGDGHVSAGEFLNDSGYSSSPSNRTRIAVVKGNIKQTEKNMKPITHSNRPGRKHSGPYGSKQLQIDGNFDIERVRVTKSKKQSGKSKNIRTTSRKSSNCQQQENDQPSNSLNINQQKDKQKRRKSQKRDNINGFADTFADSDQIHKMTTNLKNIDITKQNQIKKSKVKKARQALHEPVKLGSMPNKFEQAPRRKNMIETLRRQFDMELEDEGSENNSSVNDNDRLNMAKELAMLKLIRQNNQLRQALSRRDKEPKQKVQVDPYILKQVIEEIQAEMGPKQSEENGFESQNEVHSIHSGMGRLRTRSGFTLLNQLQSKNSNVVEKCLFTDEEMMSNFNFNEDSAFNLHVARNLSNQPSFLDASGSIHPSDTEGFECDIEELENMLGSTFGRIQEAIQQVQTDVMFDRLTEALAGASQPSQRMGRDHATSGIQDDIDFQSQFAESINRHFNDVLRRDLIEQNEIENSKEQGEGSDDDFVDKCQYEISDQELSQMSEMGMGSDYLMHTESQPVQQQEGAMVTNPVLNKLNSLNQATPQKQNDIKKSHSAIDNSPNIQGYRRSANNLLKLQRIDIGGAASTLDMNKVAPFGFGRQNEALQLNSDRQTKNQQNANWHSGHKSSSNVELTGRGSMGNQPRPPFQRNQGDVNININFNFNGTNSFGRQHSPTNYTMEKNKVNSRKRYANSLEKKRTRVKMENDAEGTFQFRPKIHSQFKFHEEVRKHKDL